MANQDKDEKEMKKILKENNTGEYEWQRHIYGNEAKRQLKYWVAIKDIKPFKPVPKGQRKAKKQGVEQLPLF